MAYMSTVDGRGNEHSNVIAQVCAKWYDEDAETVKTIGGMFVMYSTSASPDNALGNFAIQEMKAVLKYLTSSPHTDKVIATILVAKPVDSLIASLLLLQEHHPIASPASPSQPISS